MYSQALRDLTPVVISDHQSSVSDQCFGCTNNRGDQFHGLHGGSRSTARWFQQKPAKHICRSPAKTKKQTKSKLFIRSGSHFKL